MAWRFAQLLDAPWRARSADWVECAEGVGLFAGGDLFGQQPAGDRAVGEAPHAVPARDVGVGCAQRADERTAVGGDRPRADPEVPTFLPAHAVEVGPGEGDDGGEPG